MVKNNKYNFKKGIVIFKDMLFEKRQQINF